MVTGRGRGREGGKAGGAAEQRDGIREIELSHLQADSLSSASM